MWTFECYDDGVTPSLWQRWYAATPTARGSHDAVFRILKDRLQWREPQAKIFDSDIVEIRLTGSDNIEYRIFGFYKKNVPKVFVVVAFGYKKGKSYTPKGLVSSSVKLMKDIQKGILETVSCEIPQEP